MQKLVVKHQLFQKFSTSVFVASRKNAKFEGNGSNVCVQFSI